MCQKKETLTSKTLLLVREYPFPKWLTKFSTKRSLEARTRCKVRMPLYHQNKGQRWRCAWGLRIPCGGYSVWPFGCFIFRSKFYVAFGKENFPWRRSGWNISPRRRNCLKPTLLEYYGSNYTDFSKAVNSINNEVKSLQR